MTEQRTPNDEKFMRCTICGFIVDTSYKAEKPTCDFTTRGRAKKNEDDLESFSRAAIREAMQDAWNEICSDTGCHPLDITHQGKRLFFEPGHWADLTAKYLFANAVKLRKAAEGALVHASDVDPTAGLNPDFTWDGKDD